MTVENCESCYHGRNPQDCRCGMECCHPGITVVGIDLSLTCTGVAGHGFVERVTSSGHEDATWVDRQTRLSAVETKLRRTLATGPVPELIVIEGPSYASKSIKGQWDRAGLWWRVVDQLMLLDYPVAVVAPTLLKVYATGKGNASKQEVMLAASRRYPWADIVDDNTADAVVLYAMGMDWIGYQLETVPQVNRNALAKVAWPEGVAA